MKLLGLLTTKQEVRGLVLEDEPSSGCLRFGILRFVPIPNGKFIHFLIFYAVRTFGSVRGSEVQSSVSEDKPRFARFRKFEVRYFQVRSKSI